MSLRRPPVWICRWRGRRISSGPGIRGRRTTPVRERGRRARPGDERRIDGARCVAGQGDARDVPLVALVGCPVAGRCGRTPVHPERGDEPRRESKLLRRPLAPRAHLTGPHIKGHPQRTPSVTLVSPTDVGPSTARSRTWSTDGAGGALTGTSRKRASSPSRRTDRGLATARFFNWFMASSLEARNTRQFVTLLYF